MSTPERIIDAHCHYGSGDGLTGPWDTRAEIGKYLRRATRAGIHQVALIPALAQNYLVGNSQVMQLSAAHLGRFYRWIAVSPTYDRGNVARVLSRFGQGGDVVGIKVHHYNGRMTREVCAAAERARLPILWDVGDDIGGAELVVSEYPRVMFVIPHLGSFGDNWRAHRGCIDLLLRFANTYTDTSGVRRFDLLKEAVERCGADRMLYGSDGPWLHPAVELEKVYQLELTDVERGLVLSGNFLRLLQRRGRPVQSMPGVMQPEGVESRL